MTTQIKNYPFEVRLADTAPAAVLADQVKSVDGRACKATRKGRASGLELAEVRAKLLTLLGSQELRSEFPLTQWNRLW
jgi:mRNA interferase MazF